MAKVFEYDQVSPVKVTEGYIKGYYYDGTFIFKGIPYAQAKRFHRPKAFPHWEGIRTATAYGPVAPAEQNHIEDELKTPHRYWIQNENCQNLNIWTPGLDDHKRAVMVWVHGGGYVSGSSIEQTAYDGHNLSVFGDVVVVTVNHRLNVLGYLDLSAFGPQYTNSGNAGNEDIIAALKWIHDNIASFGGNPENVTLFGQSGGGMKILDIMQMPAADGMYHKAIIMSGVNAGTLSPIPYGSGKELVEAILDDLNIEKNNVDALESIPYSELSRAYMKACPGMYLSGKYFGGGPQKNEFYLGVPSCHGFRPDGPDIPMMFGSVLCEFDHDTTALDRSLTDEARILMRLKEKYHDHAKIIIDAFRTAYPQKHPTDVLGIDRVIRPEAMKLAKSRAAQFLSPVYMYVFALDFPLENHKPAWHCSDIPFAFHNAQSSEVCSVPGLTEDMERIMSGSFVSFAKTGIPKQEGLAEWPAINNGNIPTMIFDQECRVCMNHDETLYEALQKALPPFTFAELIGMNSDRLQQV